MIDPDIDYCIVSKDKGYDSAIRMAASLGYTNVHRADTVKNVIAPQPAPAKKPLPVPPEQKADPIAAAKAHFKDVLGLHMGDESIAFILDAARNSKTKQGFYAAFVQKYGQETGLKNYSNIKSEYNWLCQLVK